MSYSTEFREEVIILCVERCLHEINLQSCGHCDGDAGRCNVYLSLIYRLLTEFSDEFRIEIKKQMFLRLLQYVDSSPFIEIRKLLMLTVKSSTCESQSKMISEIIAHDHHSLYFLMFKELSVERLEMSVFEYLKFFPQGYDTSKIIHFLSSATIHCEGLIIRLVSNHDFANWLIEYCSKRDLYNSTIVYHNYLKLLNYLPEELYYSTSAEICRYIYKYYNRYCTGCVDRDYLIEMTVRGSKPKIQIKLMIYFMTNLYLRSIFLSKLDLYQKLLEVLSEEDQKNVMQVIGARIKKKNNLVVSRGILVKDGVVRSATQFHNELKQCRVQELKEQREQKNKTFQQRCQTNKKKISLLLSFSPLLGSGGISLLIYNILYPISNIHLYRLAFAMPSLAIIACLLFFVCGMLAHTNYRNRPDDPMLFSFKYSRIELELT